jgi:PmbA protein
VEQVMSIARRSGAQQAAASAQRSRSSRVGYRDEALEEVAESTSWKVVLDLYVDGRYSSHWTSDLRADALSGFAERAVRLTRALEPDPFRGLADPELYREPAAANLDLRDNAYEALTIESRQEVARAVAAAARTVEGPIVSVSSRCTDHLRESVRIHSNGFSGSHEETDYQAVASVAVDDPGGRKPAGHARVRSRHFEALPEPGGVGIEAAKRALAQVGQTQLPSRLMRVVIENRAARILTGHLLRPMRGPALQQKRSFLFGRLGEAFARDTLTLIDDPLAPRGFGSRRFDRDGLPARRRTLVDRGVLASYLVDVYYARKLGVPPTGGTTSNLRLLPGRRGLDAILAEVGEGLYVTGIVGGNSNATSGDFSHGIVGFEISSGRLGGPVGEMNIAGSHTSLWKRLVEVGEDPYPYDAILAPTLVFDEVSVSGA